MKRLILGLCLSVSVFASRLDPIIVSSKSGLQESQLTSSVEIIGEEDIKKNVSNDLVDLLRSKASLNIIQTGGPGGNYTISIRGTNTGHALVLIDGIRVNDPTDINAAFNIPSLRSLDIERVEIVKGPQSILYGSDAIGGVINIITKKGEDGGSLSIETGAQDELAGSMTIYGKSNVLYLNAFYNESDELSSIKDGDEKDKNVNKGFTANYSQVIGEIEGQWQAKITDSFAEFDNSTSDSEINFGRNLTQVYSQILTLKNLTHKLSHVKTDRFSRFSSSFESIYEGGRTNQELNLNFKTGKVNHLAGILTDYSTYRQSGGDEFKTNQSDVFISSSGKFDTFIFNGGIRHAAPSDFNSFTSFNAGIGKNLENRQQIKLNYSTGFKAPSLFQLFTRENDVNGNENLNPEKSKSLELVYSKRGKFNYTASVYYTEIDDFIVFVGSTYENANSLKLYGLDLSFDQTIGDFYFKEGILLNRAEDSSRDDALRKPEAKANINISYSVSDTLNLNYEWTYVSSQFDVVGFPSTVVDLKPYDVSNITVNYEKDSFNYKLGIRNIFDREYEETAGFSTLGLNGYLKVQYNY